MEYLDWAHLDLAAAVDQHRHAERPLFMIGHSFGGHAFGLLPNHDQVAGFYTSVPVPVGTAGCPGPSRCAY